MKKRYPFAAASAVALALLFAGCAGARVERVPTPAPTPTPAAFAMPAVPANTEESFQSYGTLTLEEQLKCHSIGRLVYTAAHSEPGADYYEAVRAYVIAYMAEGGVELPEGFTVSDDSGTALYFEGDAEGESAPAARFYVTDFNAAQNDRSVLASVLELESDYLSGEDFPRYIARAVLVPESPKSEEHFPFDADHDGSLDYAFRFYLPDVAYEESQSECYIVRLEDWRFVQERVTPEAWAAAKEGYASYGEAYAMRENVKKGVNLSALSLEHALSLETPYTGKGGKGVYTVKNLFLPTGETAALTIKYLYENGASRWELSLDAPGGALTGGFGAGAFYYETSVLCTDLTGDGGEEVILSVMPRDGGGAGGELHVFTARSGALEEILTICDGDPAEAQAKYAASYLVVPDGFTYADGTSAPGFQGVYTRATGISTAGFKLIRVTAERGGVIAQTYLWWNGDSFEIVRQKAIK
ncbi:MAG: hypothetical protein ABFC62_09825 [Clostridiaceae bacterium]